MLLYLFAIQKLICDVLRGQTHVAQLKYDSLKAVGKNRQRWGVTTVECQGRSGDEDGAEE